MNRKANLDTSERGTLVPPNPANGIKNTEMTTCKPKVDNSRTCYTCRYCTPIGGGFGLCVIQHTLNCLVTKNQTCDDHKQA